jgi:HlyD family secretion protein
LTVREVTFDDQGQVVRDEDDKNKKRRRRKSNDSDELPPGHELKEVEGVFVVVDDEVEFRPIEVGIAGEKYFEVISGLEEGDRVVTGPFSSVRELRDGAPVKVEESHANGN